MNELLKRFLNLCLLSGGPQDIPYSPILFRLLLALYLLVGCLSWMMKTSFLSALIATALDVFILLLYVYIVLINFSKLTRYIQTISALLGIGVLFQILEMPLLYYIEQTKVGETAAEAFLVLIALYSWSLAIYAHVFQQALGSKMLVAFVLTLSYVIITLTSFQLFFPYLGA